MFLRFKSHVPWFELSILLVLAAIGWATLELNRLTKSPGTSQGGIETKHEALPEVVQERMGRYFRQAWERYVLSNSNAVQTLQDVRDPRKLPGAYRAVADRLQTELPKIHRSLESFSKQTNWNSQVLWEQRTRDLKDWLWVQQLVSEQERLVAQSQELAAKGSNMLTMDLGDLYREAGRQLTNYVEKGKLLCTLARFLRSNAPPGSSNSVARAPAQRTNDSSILRDAQAEAQDQLQSLLGLAGKARIAASMLDFQPMILPEPLEKVERDFAQAGNDALELAFLSERTALASGLNAFLGRLQPVYYAMLAAAFALAVFLISAIYRRIVEGLRFRLYENTTESKLADQGQFIAWLSHEIRHSLTAINAWQWTIQKAAKEGSLEHQGTVVIRKEIDRVNRVLKDALSFASPGAPKLITLKAEPVLREILELLGPQLEPRGIRLSMDSPVDTRFTADPQQLKQVLINLVTNAAESIEHEGTITLRARKELGQLKERHAEILVLEVEDSGSGIAPEIQQRLFDPFFSTKEEGTGLGLPIAAKIIDKHGGALEFETDLNEGTKFRILLPVHNEVTSDGKNPPN